MSDISFKHLDSIEFEKFCYRLLEEMGFKNVDWRKGTGKNSSPADSGRDIEADHFVEDIDDEVNSEKWFVEVKHFKRGVPPKEIGSALEWAQSKGPDKLLIIVSNFLSNRCKDFLEEYKRNRKPKFEIKTWENPDLAKLTLKQPELLSEFGLTHDFIEPGLLHPSHLRFIKKPPTIDLDIFFDCLEEIGLKKREKMLEMTKTLVIHPRFRKPRTDNETLENLRIDPIDYKSFKEKCYELSSNTSEIFLITAVVYNILSFLLNWGDKYSVSQKIENHEKIIEILGKQMEEAKDDEKESFERLIEKSEQIIEELPRQTENYKKLYNSFCDKVLSELYVQEVKYMSKGTKDDFV